MRRPIAALVRWFMQGLIAPLVGWYMRTYVAWAKRHEPWSFIIDFGSFALATVAIFLLFRATLGLWAGIAVAVVAAAYLFSLLLHAKRNGRVR